MAEHTPNAESKQKQKRKLPKGWIWPIFIISLLVLNFTGVGLLILFSTGDDSFHVEKDYYKKAVQWDKSMAQERENQKLGWSIIMSLDLPSKERIAHLKKNKLNVELILIAKLLDRDKKTIDKAKLNVEAYHMARAAQRHKAELTPEKQSHDYRSTMNISSSGRWRFHFTAEHKGKRFTSLVEYNVPSI